MYEYLGTVKRWVDGDTVDVVVDLGFTVQLDTRFRLLGIDTPEVRGEEREAGLAAAAYAESLAPPGSVVMVRSHKAGKYGRWLAEVWPASPGLTESGVRALLETGSVNDQLIDAGHAQPY